MDGSTDRAPGTEASRTGRCIMAWAHPREDVRFSLGWLRRRIFGISAGETSFTRRGFRGGDEWIHQHLERIGRILVCFFNAVFLTRKDLTPRSARLT